MPLKDKHTWFALYPLRVCRKHQWSLGESLLVVDGLLGKASDAIETRSRKTGTGCQRGRTSSEVDRLERSPPSTQWRQWRRIGSDSRTRRLYRFSRVVEHRSNNVVGSAVAAGAPSSAGDDKPGGTRIGASVTASSDRVCFLVCAGGYAFEGDA